MFCYFMFQFRGFLLNNYSLLCFSFRSSVRRTSMKEKKNVSKLDMQKEGEAVSTLDDISSSSSVVGASSVPLGQTEDTAEFSLNGNVSMQTQQYSAYNSSHVDFQQGKSDVLPNSAASYQYTSSQIRPSHPSSYVRVSITFSHEDMLWVNWYISGLWQCSVGLRQFQFR